MTPGMTRPSVELVVVVARDVVRCSIGVVIIIVASIGSIVVASLPPYPHALAFAVSPSPAGADLPDQRVGRCAQVCQGWLGRLWRG
jgi:hypothetical protein